ncbi:MAG: glycosyltransferase [Candidatus Amulumruptor caecigallinarius]|nr:glycosyltransferase [Candidatus Amulumruptor caecigallinarius]
MKVVLINKSDSTGGAAVVTMRLLNALRNAGVDACMLVCEKRGDSQAVIPAAPKLLIKEKFVLERLKIFMENGFRRDSLFKIDTAAEGLPLWRNRHVREADVVCLNWVNQGMLSLNGVDHILAMGKPVVWTMHDMWNFTGICHHAGSCRHYLEKCGCCPLMKNMASANDISAATWLRKKRVYDGAQGKLHFVAVSNWLADLARRSSLIGDEIPLSVIPNAFPIPADMPAGRDDKSRFRILMGAARLDDPVKGFPLLIKATEILKRSYPNLSDRMELVTFGGMKDDSNFGKIAINHTHLGVVRGEHAVERIYRSADVVVSTSLYETLPGTLVEGQVYGCIPVSFSRGGQSDIVSHRLTGYLADWSDDEDESARNIAEGLVWAMSQPGREIRARMYESAMQKFEASRVAARYITLFNSIKQNI